MSTDVAADVPAPEVEVAADPVVETTAEAAAGDAKPAKETKAKAAKAKKPSAPRKPRATPAHPTYAEMVSEAITALKERTGASHNILLKLVTVYIDSFAQILVLHN
uniref:Histone H1 n=1 Tax=Aegilops tauschii TaxID=37682 RepID=M8B095_AEGTA